MADTYYLHNRDRIRQQAKARYRLKGGEILERVKARYWLKRDTILAYHHRPDVRRRQAQLDRIRRFGLTLEQMAIEQGSVCAICENERPLVVDHDHQSGKVRGLLCRGCNSKLAWLERFDRVIGDYRDGRLSA